MLVVMNLCMQSVKLHTLFELHNAVTFQMSHYVITFNENLQNLQTLVTSYKVIRGATMVITRYYENLEV